MRASDVRLVVVGPGRVGGSLLGAAKAAGIDVDEFDRRRNPTEAEIGGASVLLCVPDASIEEVCRGIAALGPKLVGHVSGATTLTALAAAADAGAETFSIHPLQTFPGPDTDPGGIPCAIAGSSQIAREYADDLARALGMDPFELPESQRAAYHAAASMASNFLVALEEAAAGMLERSGVEDGRRLLAPLVLTTARNWADRGAEALTGPVARGDEETVTRQREAVAATWPELVDSFDALAEVTRLVAGRQRPGGGGADS